LLRGVRADVGQRRVDGGGPGMTWLSMKVRTGSSGERWIRRPSRPRINRPSTRPTGMTSSAQRAAMLRIQFTALCSEVSGRHRPARDEQCQPPRRASTVRGLRCSGGADVQGPQPSQHITFGGDLLAAAHRSSGAGGPGDDSCGNDRLRKCLFSSTTGRLERYAAWGRAGRPCRTRVMRSPPVAGGPE
jgi:hypothetical protein